MKNIKDLIKLIVIIVMLIILGAIFLCPIYFVITQSWTAGFLFLVSWIPTVFVAKAFHLIVENW